MSAVFAACFQCTFFLIHKVNKITRVIFLTWCIIASPPHHFIPSVYCNISPYVQAPPHHFIPFIYDNDVQSSIGKKRRVQRQIGQHRKKMQRVEVSRSPYHLFAPLVHYLLSPKEDVKKKRNDGPPHHLVSEAQSLVKCVEI